jgi:ABC-type cobalamin/Fe3+-siderophores transport system ATPase subunit
MNAGSEGNIPEELLKMLSAPGVVLVYGPEGSGKSALVMYLISKTVSPQDKVLLYDSSNAIEVFRRLGPKLGEDFVRRVYRVPVRGWDDQRRWVLNMGLIPKAFKKVVFDEFTFPYVLQLFRTKESVKNYMRLHRELLFQVAYLRYSSQNSGKTVFLVTRERSTGDPLGGAPIKKIASFSIRLHKSKAGLHELEVEGGGDGISKIILSLDP